MSAGTPSDPLSDLTTDIRIESADAATTADIGSYHAALHGPVRDRDGLVRRKDPCWIKKIEIPYANIAHVTTTRWLNPERITVVLKTSGEFGTHIHFLPSPRMFPLFSPHPTYLQIVDLLRRQNDFREN